MTDELDLTEFAAEIGSEGPVTIAGLATRGGPVEPARARHEQQVARPVVVSEGPGDREGRDGGARQRQRGDRRHSQDPPHVMVTRLSTLLIDSRTSTRSM